MKTARDESLIKELLGLSAQDNNKEAKRFKNRDEMTHPGSHNNLFLFLQ